MNAADFYVVPGLKRLCEQWLVETLNTTNMVDRFSELPLLLLLWIWPHRLILGDTYSAVNLRQTAKEMLLANSKKLDQIPDWRKKLSTRTELTLEVLGELASSLWSPCRYYGELFWKSDVKSFSWTSISLNVLLSLYIVFSGFFLLGCYMQSRNSS